MKFRVERLSVLEINLINHGCYIWLVKEARNNSRFSLASKTNLELKEKK